MSDEIYKQIVARIIEQQETIIGPVAVEQASQVHNLQIDWSKHQVSLTKDPQKVIDELVEQYKELFGQIAVQVSKDAVKSILTQLPPDQRPKSLQ